MPHRKRSIKKKRAKATTSSYTRRNLKEDDIVKFSGSPGQKQKSVGFVAKYIFPDVKELSPLDRLNLMTSSGASKLNRSKSPQYKSSRHKYKDNNIIGNPINRVITIHCDKKVVKRLYSPFNKFSKKSNRNIAAKMIPNQSQYSHVGLSPREKSYVIFSCQSRSTRYHALKDLAASAIKNNKIFTIEGRCGTVRKALLERGWVEKMPPNKMNLSKIRNGSFSNDDDVHNELEKLLLSNLVEKCPVSFIWQSSSDNNDTAIDMGFNCPAVVNKLKVDATWTTKQGLCSSMKQNYWFYMEDVAEVNGPRTYNSYNAGEKESFIKDFQITACTSLLKWVLSMVANERPVFVATGDISMNILVFALNRCKEFLYSKRNKDLDGPLNTASNGQWNKFLKKYYSIIGKQNVFLPDKIEKLPVYLNYAKFLLKEIHRYKPQLSCEGCHDIWIIKPAHCSRGRGIRIASKLSVITKLLDKANAKFVVQKYIEEPLLIYETKFDIRQYYLVTSTYPLIIWMYQDCYLKYSSQKYSVKNYHESIHLTNNAVQRKYKNCPYRHPDLPQNNMWDLDKYRQYLNKIGKDTVWDNIIYPGMKKAIVAIMLSCQDSLSVSKNRFELYGCDFILDKTYTPWLIEINSCPDLNPTTQVTAKICPAVVVDIVKVVIDLPRNAKASTGKFECIYRQPMTMPRYGGALDLIVQGYPLRPDYFYKGKVSFDEDYHSADIDEEFDIRTILNLLKQGYETDIMMEPDDDFLEEKKDASGQNTESEFELSVAASAVNDQINDLFDRVTSEHSDGSTSVKPTLALDPQTTVSNESITLIRATSETGISVSRLKTASHSALVTEINITESNNIPELEDGPTEKTSTFGLNYLKRAIKLTSNAINLSNKDQSYEDLLDATAKIMSFIDKKEKQQLQDGTKISN